MEKNGHVAFRTKLKARSLVKRKDAPFSLSSSSGDGLDQDKKRRCVEWRDMTIPKLKVEFKKRELKVGGNKGDLIE